MVMAGCPESKHSGNLVLVFLKLLYNNDLCIKIRLVCPESTNIYYIHAKYISMLSKKDRLQPAQLQGEMKATTSAAVVGRFLALKRRALVSSSALSTALSSCSFFCGHVLVTRLSHYRDTAATAAPTDRHALASQTRCPWQSSCPVVASKPPCICQPIQRAFAGHVSGPKALTWNWRVEVFGEFVV